MDELEISQMCKKKRRSLGYIDVTGRPNLNAERESSPSSSDASDLSDEIRTDRLQYEQPPANERAIDDLVETNDELPTIRSDRSPCDESDHRDSNQNPDHQIDGAAASVLEKPEPCESPAGPVSIERKDSGISVSSIESFRLTNPKSSQPKPKKHLIIEKRNREIECQRLKQHQSTVDRLMQQQIISGIDALQINPGSTHQHSPNEDESPSVPAFNQGNQELLTRCSLHYPWIALFNSRQMNGQHESTCFQPTSLTLPAPAFGLNYGLFNARSPPSSPASSESSPSTSLNGKYAKLDARRRAAGCPKQRLDEKRTRNREAARRCRRKKQERIEKLEAEKAVASAEVLQQHKFCGCMFR